MRKTAVFAAIAALTLVPGALWGRQSPTPPAPSSQAPQASVPQDSLAAAARKAREQKAQSSAKPARVFTNDNLPSSGGISTVGAAPSEGAGEQAAGPAAPSGPDEKAWRERFAALQKKLAQDQADLAVMQREMGNVSVQNYSNPVKAMQQGLTRSDISQKSAQIDAMQKQVAADQKAIEDAKQELRKAGGEPGWAR